MSVNPRKHGELTGEAGPGEWVVYDPDADEAHLLNDTAKAIWELCDGATTTSEMAVAISEVTGIELAQARADVETTVASLRSLGLVDF